MTDNEYKTCPYCGKEIKAIDVKCRYCKSLLYEEKRELKEKRNNEVKTYKNKNISLPDKQVSYRRNKKNILITVIAIVSVIFIAGVVFINGVLDSNNKYSAVENQEPEKNTEAFANKEDPKEDIKKATQDEAIDKYVSVNVSEATYLHLRSGPGSNYSSIDQLNRGTALKVVNESRGPDGDLWLHVIARNGREGWVHSNYVTSKSEIMKYDDIGEERREELKAKKDKDFYNDFILNHLGWSKYKILDRYGFPDSIYGVGGSGGDGFSYEDMGVTFIFAYDHDFSDAVVVTGLFLTAGSEVLEVKVGMTLDEIESIWGKPIYRGSIRKDEDEDGMCYFFGETINKSGELEIYIYSPGEDEPTEIIEISWKKYNW